MIDKTYKFNATKANPYIIEVSDFKRSRGQWQFNARVIPPTGHVVVLKNVKYISVGKGYIEVPRGSGFQLTITSRLENKLRRIGKQLSSMPVSKVKRSSPKPSAPKLFNRDIANKLKQQILTGEIDAD